ncbi:calcium-transporting ATPase 12, plasma membrane-type-like [Cucumis melo var. makuwa]|uniref:Calcium-transporting ATPase 12, plasma membrane-type-like n=2 Tax=Cucumis melo TaxID=3656 RepID=A0A5D3D744_CUCMM|nr:calcium-transporting ATPase 12, plasma membrane-type-like [Cucumis melo var. makuwa]
MKGMSEGADGGGDAQPLLLPSPNPSTTSYKPAGFKFRQIVLGILFLLCLKSRSTLPFHTVVNVIDIIPLEEEREMKKGRLKQIVKEKNLVALEKEFGGVEEAVSFMHSEWDTPVTIFFLRIL